MMKKNNKFLLRVVPLLVMLCLLLTGCGCKHVWVDADCVTPKTCSECQVTEGEALGHTYADATCEAPKTCTVCKATDGEPLGHTWVDATCQVVKTCSVCQKTEGELADHKWVDATTETPKTCSVCQKTEGERIITDSRFKTADCKELFGTWSGIAKMDCEKLIGEGFTTKAELNISIIFNNDGTMKQLSSMVDANAFNQKVEEYFVEALYKEFSTLGLNKEKANEAMIAQYGMDVEAYAKRSASAFNWESIFATDLQGVYYVSGGKMYSGTTWKGEIDEDDFSITGNTLYIEGVKEVYPDLVLTRAQVLI